MKFTDDALRTIWKHIAPKDLRRDEQMRLALYDACYLLETGEGMGFGVEYWRTDRQGNMIRTSYVHRQTTLDPRRLDTFLHPNQVIEYVSAQIRYLVSIVRPFRIPKGRRLFGRKPRWRV